MALLLDAGALIAYERANPLVVALLTEAQRNGTPVRTMTGVVAQVWRDGARQARLARLLGGVDERSFDPDAARRTGRLLAIDGGSDVVDASVVDIAQPGDEIVTTDPDDLARLATSAGKSLSVLPIST